MMTLQNPELRSLFVRKAVLLTLLFMMYACYPVDEKNQIVRKPVGAPADSIALNGYSDDSLSSPDYFTEIGGNRIYTVVEEAPMFQDMQTFLRDQLIYPVDALDQSREETVLVSFIVGRDGRLRNIRAVTPTHTSLNNEAVRLVSLMHDWTPGMANGEPVDVRCTLPVKFSLENMAER